MELVFSSLKVYMYMPCMRLFNLTASVKQLRLTGVYYYYYYYYCYYYYIIVSFMQGSHTHIPGTNHVPRGYIVAAILSLLFVVPLCLVPALALLFFYVSTFRSLFILLLLLCLARYLYTVRRNRLTANTRTRKSALYEGWNFNSGNYLFTTDTK